MAVAEKSGKNKPTKASVARDFMKKIGAFGKNPPENWVEKVESHLKEQGFSLPASSRVQIYAIKSKAMKKTSKKPAKSSSPKAKKKAHSGSIQKLSIEDLSAAKRYASSNGGVEKCIEVFKALQLLSN